MGEPRLGGERRLNGAVAVETMVIDRTLVMQPGNGAGFCNQLAGRPAQDVRGVKHHYCHAGFMPSDAHC